MIRRAVHISFKLQFMGSFLCKKITGLVSSPSSTITILDPSSRLPSILYILPYKHKYTYRRPTARCLSLTRNHFRFPGTPLLSLVFPSQHNNPSRSTKSEPNLSSSIPEPPPEITPNKQIRNKNQHKNPLLRVQGKSTTGGGKETKYVSLSYSCTCPFPFRLILTINLRLSLEF